MAASLLSAPPTSSVSGASPLASPTGSNTTSATFGQGSRNYKSNSPSQRHETQSRRDSQREGVAHNSASNTSNSQNPTVGGGGRNVHVIDGPGGRILCVADVRGNLSAFNRLAKETNAQAIVHTGDFGFYESESFERISDRTLRHLVQYSTLIQPALRSRLLTADVPGGARSGGQGAGGAPAAAPPPSTPCKEMRLQMLSHPESPLLTEFPKLLNGQLKLDVPVYTVWGACEDVRILEKLRTREYVIENLHVLDEASSVALEVGGVRLRLFGLGGAVVLHKLFDNGEGAATIAGGQGTMWTTILQIGELIDTAQRCYDPTETRLLITHASPGREGLLMQLALALKADLTISAGLHFRYGVSYNEFSVQSDTEQFRRKLLQSKSAFGEVWDSVRQQVEDVVDDQQRILLNNGLAVTNRAPNAATATGAVHEEPAWKNTWNWNLPDAAFGHLILDVRDGRVSSEMKSQGFNFAYRRAEAAHASPAAPVATPPTAAVTTQNALTASATTIPSGPAKMRQQQDPSQPRGTFPPRNPKQHRSPNPSHGSESKSEHGSRPTSSKGSRHERGHRSSGDESIPRGPKNGVTTSTIGKAAKEAPVASEATSAAVPKAQPADSSAANGAQGQKESLPASVSGQSVKSSGAAKSHRSKKSNASSRSEKSGSESEAKHSLASAARPSADPAGAAVEEGKDNGAAHDGSSSSQRGGRGRGGGRGGRGGRGGGRGGGSQSQERRKSGAGETKSQGGESMAKAGGN